MNSWKNIFCQKCTGSHSYSIAENVFKGRIPRGDIRLGQLDDKAEAEADEKKETIYAQCGEVIRQP